MLLVAVRGDSLHVVPELRDPRRRDGRLVVTVVLPPPGDTAERAARGDIGTYHAVLVERFDGAVVFEERSGATGPGPGP